MASSHLPHAAASPMIRPSFPVRFRAAGESRAVIVAGSDARLRAEFKRHRSAATAPAGLETGPPGGGRQAPETFRLTALPAIMQSGRRGPSRRLRATA
jgi:hypothetical protein